jgi:hypothetical protein
MMKKLINIYNLDEIKKLNRSEIFFLINALQIHPAFTVTKTVTKIVFAVLIFFFIKKLLKVNITITKE